MDASEDKVNYPKISFWQKFSELQKVMWDTNNGLVASHTWDSRPESWPWLRRGINFWVKDHRQIYLLGNFFTWWLTSLAIVVYSVFVFIVVLRWQRGYKDYYAPAVKDYSWKVGSNVVGWALHYFPFFLMQRQLFLHHYLPALYFAVLAFVVGFDIFCKTVLKRRLLVVVVSSVLVLGSISVYVTMSPLIYGEKWTKDECNRLKVLPHWDFDCNAFYADKSMYENGNSGKSRLEEAIEKASERLSASNSEELHKASETHAGEEEEYVQVYEEHDEL